MARISVPERHFEGIAKILSLSDEIFQELVETLTKLPIRLYPKDTLTKAISGIRNIPHDDVRVITDAVLPLCLNRASSDKNTTDFVTEVIQSIEGSGSEKLKLAEGNNKEILRIRFTKILDVRSLAVSAKSTSIMFECDRSFSKARVLTDIRPVFDVKADNPPDAAILVHTLSIHYYQDGEHKDFFLAMDDEDVQVLLDALERAKVKAKNLKQVLSSAKITCVEKS